jgi:hypothetical protein
MPQNPSESLKTNVPEPLDYQSGVPQKMGSRVAYGIAAAIGWFGGSIVFFGAIMAFFSESTSDPHQSHDGSLVMFLLSVPFFGVAWYFTHRAAKAHVDNGCG